MFRYTHPMRKNNKSYTISQLAAHVNGEISGPPSLSITGITSLENPLPNHITFIRATSTTAAVKRLSDAADMAILAPKGLLSTLSVPTSVTLVGVSDSYSAFLDLVPLFFDDESGAEGIHPTSVIDPSAKIAEGASIGPFVRIGARCVVGRNARIYSHVALYDDVTIGDSVTLFSGVSVRSGCVIRDRVAIHDKAVIGADGFGYTPDPRIGLRKVPHIGTVIIESDVEIGANTCIDRGAFGPTRIGRGTKIDNLVQIGHNTEIGNFCIVCGQSAIAGSVKVGDQVVIGGGVGVADHVEIVSGVRLGGRSGVTTSLLEPGDYMGFPAVKASSWRRSQVLQRKALRKGKE
jgi:UDP-3-O-[3-hydroxymyristoyl] glucosamine N-acyltransferase